MDGCLEGGLWNLSILLVVLFFCYFAGELTGLVHPTCSTPQKYLSDLLYLVLSITCCLFFFSSRTFWVVVREVQPHFIC